LKDQFVGGVIEEAVGERRSREKTKKNGESRIQGIKSMGDHGHEQEEETRGVRGRNGEGGGLDSQVQKSQGENW